MRIGGGPPFSFDFSGASAYGCLMAVKPFSMVLAGEGKPMRRARDRSRGFTLIELLVVVVIIGLLAAILVAATMGAQKAGRRARIMRQMSDLDGAIKDYVKEYGKMPVPAGTYAGSSLPVDRVFTGTEQAKVIEILIGVDTDANPRQIVFLDIDPASFGVKTVEEMKTMLANGNAYKGPFNKKYAEEEYRPRDYMILMDLNFDDKIEGVDIDDLEMPDTLKLKSAVFSWGLQPLSYEVDNYDWKPLWTW
jgi:prepilin-type N-terminal cleavage/methylation domain-containing protein